MRATEYAGALEHLDRFPPGDFLAQALLAELIATVQNVFRGKGKAVTMLDVAPWLESSRDKMTREQKARADRRVAEVRAVSAVYEAQRQREESEDAG